MKHDNASKPHFDRQVFVVRVAELAAATGKTLSELAALAEISEASLRNYRKGRGIPKRGTLLQLARAWSVPVEWLTDAATDMGRIDLEGVYADSAATAGDDWADPSVRTVLPDPAREGRPQQARPWLRATLAPLQRNLREACAFRRVSIEQLAHRTRYGYLKVASILSGYMPSPEMIERLAAALRVPPAWLWSGKDSIERVAADAAASPAVQVAVTGPTFNVIPPGPAEAVAAHTQAYADAASENIVPVPILSGAVAAGAPSDVYEHEIEDWAFCYAPHLRHPEHTTCVRVAGDSMGAVVPHGALVGIDHAVTDPVEIARRQRPIAVVRDPNSDGVLVRWVRRTNGHVLFQPEVKSPAHTTVVWRLDDESAPNPIVGAVVFIYQACS